MYKPWPCRLSRSRRRPHQLAAVVPKRTVRQRRVGRQDPWRE
jgi:hypothetical protein